MCVWIHCVLNTMVVFNMRHVVHTACSGCACFTSCYFTRYKADIIAVSPLRAHLPGGCGCLCPCVWWLPSYQPTSPWPASKSGMRTLPTTSSLNNKSVKSPHSTSPERWLCVELCVVCFCNEMERGLARAFLCHNNVVQSSTAIKVRLQQTNRYK